MREERGRGENMKKLISCLLACAMMATSAITFAAAPSEYDSQPYSNHGIESTDPDGEINLAVIASGDVTFRQNAMYIRGSVYSNGTIMVGSGGGNFVEGLLISGTGNETYTYTHDGSTITLEGYKHIDSVTGDNSTITAYSTTIDTNGAIYDENTVALDCEVPSFDVDTTGFVEVGEATLYGESYDSGMTISENTHFTTLAGSADCITVDVTNGDVTVVVDELVISGSMPDIQVVGGETSNKLKLYVRDYTSSNGAFWAMINSAGTFDDDIWWPPHSYGEVARYNTADFDAYLETVDAYYEENIKDPSCVDLYISNGGEPVVIQGAKTGANIYIDAPSVEINGQSVIKGNITTNAETLTLTGGASFIEGTVCAPNADTEIADASMLIGQLHTDTLVCDGAGKIVYLADSLVEPTVAPTEAPVVTEAPVQTEAPVATETPAQTTAPVGDISINIVEDVVCTYPGGVVDLTIEHTTPYTWTFQPANDNNSWTVTYTNSEGVSGNKWASIITNADDATYTIGTGYWVEGEYEDIVVTVTSTEDGSVLDTAVIRVYPSADLVPEDTDPTPTPAPVPEGEEIDLGGLGYAYIFGYEPVIQRVDGEWVAEVYMAPNDAVTREQVAAMIMRMVDQKYGTTNTSYPSTSAIAAHEGTWYMRGLAYLAQNGAFDDVDSVEIGAVTRGEVAKLLAYGLNLSQTAESSFTDIADSEYKSYIEIVASYGYMNGTGDGIFEPNRVMTRAEFCQMFNNVIGRTEMGLTAQDGSTVTPETYSIVDLDGHWAQDAMLKATSAYDENGLIDVETRIANIRNILDNYDSQKWF